MKKIKTANIAIWTLGILLFAACGGSVDTVTPPPVPATEAVLTLSTTVSGMIPAGTTINSYDVTVTLPAGVMVKTTANPPETDYGVVTATGGAAGSLVAAVYSAPTGISKGTVQIHIASATGFGAGEFSVVKCEVSTGSNPKATDFAAVLDDATGFDKNSSSTVLGLEQELQLVMTVVFR